jgi:putative phosphoribosyl transferase
MIDETLTIPTGTVELEGKLAVPDDAAGTVVFAHGHGSNRRSVRNRTVADALNEAGLGTLLLDLFTPDEDHRSQRAFDIAMLASRLAAVTDWIQDRPGPENEAIGYFGTGSGAAVALSASTAPGVEVRAVVARSGRPDLAVDDLPNVRTPTLLIVGERDDAVMGFNQRAQLLLGGPNRITVVPGATHLFSEPESLQAAADLAGDWFNEHLCGTTT